MKYATRKLSLGDVVEKGGTTFYVIQEGTTTYNKLEGKEQINTYVLTSSRVRTTTDGSDFTMDGRGWVVTGVLTDSGLEKARKNPVSVSMDDIQQLMVDRLVFDSKLLEKVEKLEALGLEPEIYESVVNIVCG